jgi:hypothetical protein
LNKRLGLPEFFPLNGSSPEEFVNKRTIVEGFTEPAFVEVATAFFFFFLLSFFASLHVLKKYSTNVKDECCSWRNKEIARPQSFKSRLLQAAKEIEWRKAVNPKSKVC